MLAGWQRIMLSRASPSHSAEQDKSHSFGISFSTSQARARVSKVGCLEKPAPESVGSIRIGVVSASQSVDIDQVLHVQILRTYHAPISPGQCPGPHPDRTREKEEKKEMEFEKPRTAVLTLRPRVKLNTCNAMTHQTTPCVCVQLWLYDPRLIG